MNPTLPVLATKGKDTALQKVCNQHPRYVGEDYTYNKGNALFHFFFNQLMCHLPYRLGLSLIYYYTMVNQQSAVYHFENWFLSVVVG